MTGSAGPREIVITRVLDAPRELVWRAWTEPEHLAAWWGAPGWRTPASGIVMDVRPGGAFVAESVSEADGSRMTVRGVYREVVPPERLVLEEPAEGAWHDGALSVVTFADLGGGRTELVLRTTVGTTDEMGAAAAAGMRGAIERLAAALG